MTRLFNLAAGMGLPSARYARFGQAHTGDLQKRRYTTQEAPDQPAPSLALGQPRVDEGERAPPDEEVGVVVHRLGFSWDLHSLRSARTPSHALPNPTEFGRPFGRETLSSPKITKNN